MANLTNEALGWGTKFQYGSTADHTTASYTDICTEVIDIVPPTFESADIVTKHFQSSDQAETKVPGWSTSGDATFKANFSPAEYNTLKGFYRVAKAYRVVFSSVATGGGSSSAAVTGNVVRWNGYLKSIESAVDMDGLIQVSGTIAVSGLPALA